MQIMQVSVVIPTYNRASTLRRALGSVSSQVPPPEEIIVVDDGSTDGTRTVIARTTPEGGGTKQSDASRHPERSEGSMRSFGPSGLRMTYLFQPNRGPAAARNLGIPHARAEFIAFLDSDDEWLPGKLAAQLKFFQENPDYLICQTEEIWIRNGRRVNPMKKHKKYGGLIFEKCLPLCIVSPSSVMMKREFFDQVGLFDESLPACEDYDLWLRASARFPIGLVEKPYVVKYGGHADQRSRQFPVMDRFRIEALRKILVSGILTPTQREAALRELTRKSQIIVQGARKRFLPASSVEI